MLGGKKRVVVDESIFKDLVRDQSNIRNIIGIPEAVKELGGVYLPYDDVDTVRVALGKYWDYEAKLNEEGQVVPLWTGEGSEPIFGPRHPSINIIYGHHLDWYICDDGSFGTDPQPVNFIDESYFGGFKQSIVLESGWHGNLSDVRDVLAPGVDDPGFQLYQNNLGIYWIYLMKTGIITSDGTHLKPIIKNDKIYYDHYHEAMSPYTPTELANQQVAGKALYVDYKTYYNNRAYSKNYETFIADPSLQNCLPNIVAFTKIISNSALTEDTFLNLTDTINLIKPWYKIWSHSGIRNDTYTNLLQVAPLETSFLLFDGIIAQYYPSGLTDPNPTDHPGRVILGPLQRHDEAADLEIFFEGDVNKLTLERLLTLDAKKQDADALIKVYLKHFRNALLDDSRLAQRTTYGVTNRISPKLKLGALEYINSNLIFGSNAAAVLHKAKQYKDYFPMYFEMSFTSQETLLGDKIKKAKMTRFLGQEIAAAQNIFRFHNPSDPGELSSGGHPYYQDNSTNHKFIDYIEKQVSGEEGFISVPAFSNIWTDAYKAVDKKAITLISNDPDNPGVLDKWMSETDYSSENPFHTLHPDQQDTDGDDPPLANPSFEWSRDLRNYVTYIRDDAEDSAALDNDCNPLFKALFGAAFVEHLKNIYNEKARTYSDILDGVPAYTEDLFYLIKKFRKNNGDDGEICVQNIVIPNTSDLNIVEYVDTQVKYGAHATYRYEVHVYRVVFGSKYYYRWPYSADDHVPPPINADGNNNRLINPLTAESSPIGNTSLFFENITYQPLITGNGFSPEASYDFKYTAKVDVYVEPSIKLIGEQMFSTPEIKILDSPPVPPFVNIVPYRAISNKIKIILDGSTDTFRATPVIILDGDQATFNDILNSQFSHLNQGGDGKVKFSSDDRVANFQTFRIEEKPTSYSDFVLHPNEDFAIIETGGSAAFDDSIEPNKKYYYTFRTVDNHGHVSNPTPVYEVELIDEKGAVKPLIRTISMEVEENKAHLKEFQKYLLLRPTDRQIYFSEQSDVNSIFSTDNEQNNKKKYKMRITSKGTGKKIDINFSFTKKDVT